MKYELLELVSFNFSSDRGKKKLLGHLFLSIVLQFGYSNNYYKCRHYTIFQMKTLRFASLSAAEQYPTIAK